MRNSPHSYTISNVFVLTTKLQTLAVGWLLACDINQHSERTIYNRRMLIRHLVWFLELRGFEECGVNELRAFLAYCTNGHKERRGRWEQANLVNPIKPRTVHT